jgi:hypothetical protein
MKNYVRWTLIKQLVRGENSHPSLHFAFRKYKMAVDIPLSNIQTHPVLG